MPHRHTLHTPTELQTTTQPESSCALLYRRITMPKISHTGNNAHKCDKWSTEDEAGTCYEN